MENSIENIFLNLIKKKKKMVNLKKMDEKKKKKKPIAQKLTQQYPIIHSTLFAE